MNQRSLATRLALMVALSGLLPILLFAITALQILRSRGEHASQEALAAMAQQAAGRVSTYIAQQREMLRALANGLSEEPDGDRRLSDVALDAPTLGRLRLINAATPSAELPLNLKPEHLVLALSGREVSSDTYMADLSPALDVCVPAGRAGRAVCTTLDLLELQRQVQRIRVGERGYALAFDRTGKLLASGAGGMRSAVFTGEAVPESQGALQLARGSPAPQRLTTGEGNDVLAGWAYLPELGWSIAVEEPADEALRGAREALVVVTAGALGALAISIAFGAQQARRMLAQLEMGERWRTAGRIAAGITHDLGHRLTILQQTAYLAEMDDPAVLPRIRDALHGEVDTLKKFVADFADLTREARPSEFLPVELNGLAQSVCNTARLHAEKASVTLEVKPAAGEVWVAGDRYLLERAALNLAWNAIEASPPGAAIVIRVGRDDGTALFHVEDKGPGIAAHRLETLFDSFISTKRTGAHVGMGLPNVRRIMIAHAGDVSVQSRPGAGSTFTLHLPVGDHSSSPSP